MTGSHQDPISRPLRGLDPSKMLGVLDAPGEAAPHIPGWTVLGIAGRGGFGAVWKARRESDAAIAAIKIAPASDPDTVERIEEETSVLRALDHPHIVALLDSGPLDDPDGGLFLAMKFIDGPELSQEIPADGLPPERAYRLFRQIAEAVAYAHDAGVLHRDLKPANILLDSGDHALVADFGLALPVYRRVHALSLTRAGMIAGTAEYLPPEAYRADYRPSPAADVFALGVILHEMLTGTPPRGAWPSVSSIRKGVDVRVDTVIRRALDPDPAKRWAGVREMLSELDSVLASPPRFAGTPLVTYPIRVADCLWTILGLIICLAGTSTLLHLAGSGLKLPLDLIGSHSKLTGAFLALFILLTVSIPLSLWQILRLRRFRHIPLREALPSPFGLKLGHHRTAAALVACSQLFCLAFPTLQMLVLFKDYCMVWMKPGTPPWIQGLAVTTWVGNQPTSPWAFGPFTENYWLWDSSGMPGNPLSQTMGRVSFLPFFIPAIMTLAGLLLAAVLLVTLYAAFRCWWCRRRFCRVMMTGLVTLAAGYLATLAYTHAADRKVHGDARGRSAYIASWKMTTAARDHAKRLLDWNAAGEDANSAAPWTAIYAEQVDFREHGSLPRAEIPRLLAAGRLRGDAFQVGEFKHAISWNPLNGDLRVEMQTVEAYNNLHSSGTSGADLLKVEITGSATIDGHTEIRTERFRRTPLYLADRRVAGAQEAASWLQALFDAVATVETNPEMADLILESLFYVIPMNGPDKLSDGWVQQSPNHRSKWMIFLRNDALSDVRPDARVEASLPGGRTRIVVPLHISPAGPERLFHADLIHISGSWRCVRLAF